MSVPSLFYNSLHITSYKLILTIANCMCCKLNLLQIAHVANSICCKLHMLPIKHVADCTFCKLQLLQIACAINCRCCKLQAFQIAHVAHYQVVKSCQKLPKDAKICQKLLNVNKS